MTPVVTAIERKRRDLVAVTVAPDAGETGVAVHDDAAIDDAAHDGTPPAHLLPLEAVVEHGLHEGQQLTEDRWHEVRTSGRRRLAIRRALEALSRRRRTVAELERLLARDFTPGEVTEALERMRDLGYLDDATLAVDYVASPRARSRGRALLRRELGLRGVADADVAPALEGYDERSAALEAGEKRMRSLAALDPERRRRRLYDYLARRGFAPDTVREVSRELLGREGEPADA